MSSNFDDMKFAVEAASGGKNTVLLDDKGYPSVMVRIPKMFVNNLIEGGDNIVHPAFIVDDTTMEAVYISKYINTVKGDRAYSLPAQDPKAYVNFEQASTYCRNKGDGWGLTPFALWSAIALWCKQNGTMPHGNNNYGSDINHAHERAVETCKDGTETAKTARTATGTGPQTWNHNNTPFGIADMNGNVWEWTAGMRLSGGVLEVIPNADCMNHETDMSKNSEDWRQVLKDGSLHTQGPTNTIGLQWKAESNIWYWDCNDVEDETENKSCAFNKVNANQGDTSNCIEASGSRFLELMALMPDTDGGEYGGDQFWANNTDERLPLRGGGWYSGASAGVFYLGLDYPRSYSYAYVGFRSAYYEIQ